MTKFLAAVAVASLSLLALAPAAQAEDAPATPQADSGDGALPHGDIGGDGWANLPERERITREWRSLPRAERIAREKRGAKPEIIEHGPRRKAAESGDGALPHGDLGGDGWANLPERERITREWRSLPKAERIAREKRGAKPEIIENGPEAGADD